MKNVNLLLGVMAALLVAPGCSKSDKTPASAEVNGVTLDLPKFNEAFAEADPEVKRTATEVGFNVRYGKYEEAMMALDKLANDPKVNDNQKKIVNTLIDQVKKLANAAPAAAPAQ
jgi:hypothetical protein